MKRIITLFLTLAMILSLVVVPTAAADQDVTLTITPDKTTVDTTTGSATVTYTIAIKVKSPDVKIGSIEFKLAPPEGMTLPATLGPSNFSLGSGLKATVDEYANVTSGIFETFAYTAGTKTFIASGTTDTRNLHENKTLMTITATIAQGTNGNLTLNATNVEFGKVDGGAVKWTNTVQTTAVTANGKLPITTISATVDAPERGEPLDTDATIPADAQYTVSDVKWLDGTNTATGNAGPSRDYTVEITLLAKDGEKFAANPAVENGYTLKTRSSDTALVIKKTFPTTSSKGLLTGTLAINGTAKVGETLTANVSALNDSTNITYQWCRNGAAITGVNSATYTLVKEDYQKDITVKVTATDASEYAGTVSSTKVTVDCDHAGGTATCQQKAKCTTCENYYGETAPHDFNGVTTWGYKGAAGHAHLCKNCNVAQDALQPHVPGAPATLTAPQTCTACGYEIAPKLKAITNIAFTMTGYEFASKITDLKVTTASTEVNFDPTTYGEDYIVVLEEDANGNGPVDVPAGSTLTFDNDTVYYVMPAFSPKDGYAFASNLKVTLDGKEASVVLDDENETGAKVAMFVLRDQDPADPEITRELTFTLKATQGGTARVPSEVFKIESVLNNETSTVTGEGFVTTNRGENTYTGTMQFKGTKSAMLDYATKTFYVRMVDGGKANWTYDTTIWQVTPNTNNDGTVSLTFNEITVTLDEDGNPEYALSETSSEKMEFEVIYTADAAKGHNHMRRQPTTNNTTATTNPSVKSPETGDAGIALYTAMSVLSLTGGAWIVGKKRK